MPPKVETSNNFDVLNRMAKLNVTGVNPTPGPTPPAPKKKKEEEPVLDDWESFEAQVLLCFRISEIALAFDRMIASAQGNREFKVYIDYFCALV